MTINEGLAWLKTLKARHTELVSLRSANANVRQTRYGNEPVVEEKPVYDVKWLDKQIQGVAKEMRLVDAAIKKQNASTPIKGFEPNEAAFGDLEPPTTA